MKHLFLSPMSFSFNSPEFLLRKLEKKKRERKKEEKEGGGRKVEKEQIKKRQERLAAMKAAGCVQAPGLSGLWGPDQALHSFHLPEP